jgi:L-fuconolactonase
MPDFPIIDAHVHLYDIDRLSYGWMRGNAKLERTHTLAELDAARGPVQLEKIVFAEVAVDKGLNIEEARFVQAMADRDSRLAGMVAHAPVEIGAAVEDHLDKLSAFSTLRGIRRLMQTEVDQDFCLKHWGMIFAIELAKRCPDVTFVLDHIGKPGIKHDLKEPWWSQIVELARLPNVVCKVSGVNTEDDHRTWTEARVKPFVERAIEAFGFDRVMYGSDWTVSNLTHEYPVWVAILDRLLAGTSADEKRKFWRDNAARVYRV